MWCVWKTGKLMRDEVLPRLQSFPKRIFACLHFAYHFVLLQVVGHYICVFDSFRAMGTCAAKDNLNKFKESYAKYVDDRPQSFTILYTECPQQVPGDNNCGLHVVNNLYRELFAVSGSIITRKQLREDWEPCLPAENISSVFPSVKRYSFSHK